MQFYSHKILKSIKIIITVVLVMIYAAAHLSCKRQNEIFYVGTYSERGSQGIYVYSFDRNSGTFDLLQTNPEITSPNFIAIHPLWAYAFL